MMDTTTIRVYKAHRGFFTSHCQKEVSVGKRTQIECPHCGQIHKIETLYPNEERGYWCPEKERYFQVIERR